MTQQTQTPIDQLSDMLYGYPEASAEARRSATDELLRLARMVDNLNTKQKANT
jgi:hypothetical protein